MPNYRLPKRLARITRLTTFRHIVDPPCWIITVEERTKKGNLLFSHLKRGKKLASFPTRDAALKAIVELWKIIKGKP